MDTKRALSLKQFVDNLPPGAVQGPSVGRYVFGSRVEDTLPYLVAPGAEAAVKADEVANMPVSTVVNVYTFDLSNEKDLKAYEGVLNAVETGWYKVIFTERHWDEEKKNMRVYLEVINRYRVIQPTSQFDNLLNQMSGVKTRQIE